MKRVSSDMGRRIMELFIRRNETTLEELIAEELGYSMRVRTKSESAYIEAPIKRPQRA
ncbi:MAG: hypothetical protein JZD41_04720 [Thermoproteus sp.]|nr:hypothetical protein [Thermoproteus sp.]MBP1449300.1 hypothetical protein [Thermoproteus sp.]